MLNPPSPVVDRTASPTPWPIWPAVGATFFGFCYFLSVGGAHAIVPTHIDWLMRGDWSQHYLGWAFFRLAPWQWPLGAVPNLGHPVGTSVAFTDANPALALLFRPFSAWLPQPFQYIGLYMALCTALQGYAGARLGQILGTRPAGALAAGCLFVLAPVLLHRMDHDTLMGQALIIASIALCLAEHTGPRSMGRPGVKIWGIAVLAMLIHPYLLAMVLPLLAVALMHKAASNGQLQKLRAVAWSIGTLLSLGACGWALGYVGIPVALGTDGFGYFSADITAWFNPREWSRLLPSFFAHRGQAYEGFGYLGAGQMALCLCGAAAGLRAKAYAKVPWRLYALVAVGVLGMVFAWSSHWCFAGRVVLDISRLYRPIASICDMLRASGRFIWLPTYLLMTASIWAVVRGFRPERATQVLAAAVVLQLIDVEPHDVRRRLTTDPHVAMVDPIWQTIGTDYDHVVLVPPHFHNVRVQCNPLGYKDKVEMPPGFLAASMGLTINSAYLSRADPVAIKAYCVALGNRMERGQFNARDVYLIDRPYLKLLQGKGTPLVCWEADGALGCVRADRPSRLVDAALARTPA